MQVEAVVPDVSDSEGFAEESEELVKLQHQDKELGPVVTFLEQGILPPEENSARRLTVEKCQYVVLNKVLYQIDNLRKNQLWLCVPVCMRSELMKEAHSWRFAGHFSPKGVYSMLAHRYWWDGMYKDVHARCRSCLTCQATTDAYSSGRTILPRWYGHHGASTNSEWQSLCHIVC